MKMTYVVNRPHRWIIVVYENDEHFGVITNMRTNRIKWFKSEANAQKFINKYFKKPKPGMKFIPEIDDHHEHALKGSDENE